jgi:hypothetical protein
LEPGATAHPGDLDLSRHLHTRSARALPALALVLLTGCATARTGTDADPPESCDFAPGLAAVETVPTEQRVGLALRSLGDACPGRLGPLALASTQASTLPRAERARVLGEAASLALPPACASSTPGAPAASVAWGCPPPPAMALSPQLLEDLDAGTYLFALAVRSRLDGANRLDANATKLIDNLMLAAALEGEAARGGATGTPPL